MISIESLSQELLPNLYVKNVTLDSNLKQETLKENPNKAGYYNPEYEQSVMTPDGTLNSNVVVSTKFLKSAGLQSDLAMLLDSELSQGFMVFVHQFTNKAVYDQVFTPNSAYDVLDSNKNPTENGKKLLTKEFTKGDPESTIFNILTVRKPFKEAVLNNNSAVYGDVDDNSQGIILPDDILEDGTTLSEIIFKIVKNS